MPEAPHELDRPARRAAIEGYIGGLVAGAGVIGGGLEGNPWAAATGVVGSALLLHGVHRFQRHEQAAESA